MFKRIQKMDDKILYDVTRLHKPRLNKVMVVFTHLGTRGHVWFALCLILFFIKATKYASLNILVGLAIAHLAGEIVLKHLVCRARPCHKLEDEAQIIKRPKYYSFPSGHTTSSFAVVAVSFFQLRELFIPILIVAAIISFSRLYLRVHYFTDVFVGLLLGLTCGTFSVFLFNAAMKTYI